MLRKSDSIGSLVKALIQAQAGIKHAVKDAKNPHFRNDYATLESVIEAIKLPLLTQGLVILQTIEHTDTGTLMITTLAHDSGEWVSSATPVYNEKGTAQGMGSGLTYARRYALAAMLMIGQTDDDGNDASTTAQTQGPVYRPPASAPAKPVIPAIPATVSATSAVHDKKELIARFKAVSLDPAYKIELSMKEFGKAPKELPIEHLADLVTMLEQAGKS